MIFNYLSIELEQAKTKPWQKPADVALDFFWINLSGQRWFSLTKLLEIAIQYCSWALLVRGSVKFINPKLLGALENMVKNTPLRVEEQARLNFEIN